MKTLTQHGKIFGIQKSHLSAIIQMFSEALYKVATPYFNNPSIWHNHMPYLVELIQNKTNGVAANIWGFIDGTIHKTTRPIYHQRVVYTWFKKCHGLKFQSVLVPDETHYFFYHRVDAINIFLLRCATAPT